MSRKKNLDIFKNVSDFQGEVNINQQANFKLNEVEMILDNYKKEMEEMKHYIHLQSKIDCKEFMIENFKQFQLDLKNIPCNSDITELKQLIALSDEKWSSSNTQTESKLDHLNEKLEANYINVDDMNEFNRNIERTLKQLIIDNAENSKPNNFDAEILGLKNCVKTNNNKNQILNEKIEELCSRLEVIEKADENVFEEKLMEEKIHVETKPKFNFNDQISFKKKKSTHLN